MNPPVWVTELANRFWATVGEPPAFPRDLTDSAMLGFPLCVVALPALHLDGVRDWLARVGVACPIYEPDRRLRGCLVTRSGYGFVFVDATDPPDERRFSVAHEIAHFLRDYDALRRTAVARLGPAILEVLDGHRHATPEERIHSVLRETPVSVHVHLLSRDPDSRPLTPLEREAEAAADRLALELLAPAHLIPSSGAGILACLAEFGLPPTIAANYAKLLVPPAAPMDRFVELITKSR